MTMNESLENTHVGRCYEDGCTYVEYWPSRQQAQAAAVWHVYDHHPDQWKAVIGDRAPQDLRPTR